MVLSYQPWLPSQFTFGLPWSSSTSFQLAPASSEIYRSEPPDPLRLPSADAYSLEGFVGAMAISTLPPGYIPLLARNQVFPALVDLTTPVPSTVAYCILKSPGEATICWIRAPNESTVV